MSFFDPDVEEVETITPELERAVEHLQQWTRYLMVALAAVLLAATIQIRMQFDFLFRKSGGPQDLNAFLWSLLVWLLCLPAFWLLNSAYNHLRFRLIGSRWHHLPTALMYLRLFLLLLLCLAGIGFALSLGQIQWLLELFFVSPTSISIGI